MRGASVRLNSTMGAHETERARVLRDGPAPDWESVRIFLEVARGGSFRTAATKLGMTGHGIAKRIEQLEQLRWLENGWKIRVAEVEHDAVSVDVPEDVARVEKLLQSSD